MLNLIRHLIAGAVILFVAFAAANGQSTDQPRNEIEVRGNVSIPTGSADFSGTTDSSQTIDFARDFSFDNKLGFDLRYIHRSENQKHKFLVQYGRDNWDQQRTLTRSFTFLGQTYVANASWESSAPTSNLPARQTMEPDRQKALFPSLRLRWATISKLTPHRS